MKTNREHKLTVECLESRWQLSAVTPLSAIPGDANFDGQFDSADLVQVWQAGKYGTDELATWGDGDWNGDGLFNTGDLVRAFQSGNYQQGVYAAKVTRTYVEGTSVRIAVDPGIPTLAGPNLHVREFVSTWHDVVSDSRLTGLTKVYIKLLNLNADDGTGHLPDGGVPLSGHYTTEVGNWDGDVFSPTGGVWEGTFRGKTTDESIPLVGRGHGGDIEGLQVRLEFAGEPTGATLTGYILDPGKK